MLNFTKNILILTRDLVTRPDPEMTLQGKRMFRPFMHFQKKWLAHFHPLDTLDEEKSAWYYLQKYMMPLIKQSASSFHVEGIQLLKLDYVNKPDYDIFKKAFESISHGFKIQPVNNEIEPREYFTLIRDKKFPCIEKMRSVNEVFCTNEPDFWHEAIGHIAPLCFQEVQEFYLEIADAILSAKTEDEYQDYLALAWTLTEYGFIKKGRQYKMFGAALVGSHLANMRYLYGYLDLEKAHKRSIIDSGFHSENSSPAMNSKGRFRFFYMNNLKFMPFFQ